MRRTHLLVDVDRALLPSKLQRSTFRYSVSRQFLYGSLGFVKQTGKGLLLWMMAGKRLTQFPTPDVHHGRPRINCRHFCASTATNLAVRGYAIGYALRLISSNA